MVYVATLKSVIKSVIPAWIATYKTTHKGILLTFDDGPDVNLTPQILDLLAEYDIKAVFFILGKQAQRYPNIVQRIVADGHYLGNHSFAHKTADEIGFKAYAKDIKHCQTILKPFIAATPTLFRPPQGKLSLSAWSAIQCNHMQAILWSIESGEWGQYSHQSVDQMLARLARDIQPHDIVLMHDNSSKVQLLLEKLLPILVEKEYTFVDPKLAFPDVYKH